MQAALKVKWRALRLWTTTIGLHRPLSSPVFQLSLFHPSRTSENPVLQPATCDSCFASFRLEARWGIRRTGTVTQS